MNPLPAYKPEPNKNTIFLDLSNSCRSGKMDKGSYSNNQSRQKNSIFTTIIIKCIEISAFCIQIKIDKNYYNFVRLVYINNNKILRNISQG